MGDNRYDNINYEGQFDWEKPYDLREAEMNGYCRVKINHEWLRLRIVSDGKDGKDVYGEIGFFQYNISEIHRRLTSGKVLKNEGFAIDQFYPSDFDYKTSDLVTRIRDYVHRFKVGEKDVIFIINYLNKIWTCQIIGYHPNPFAKEMGGKFDSLNHYIEHQENLLREKEIKS